MTAGIGQTNVYHPFPDSVIWRVDYNYDFVFQFPCYKNYYFQYYSIGDTLINSGVYRKIFVNEVQDTNTCWIGGPGYLPVPGYVGALKDDSLANKTFFVFPNSTTDSLLYDYNLTVGDKIKGIIAQFFNPYDTGVVLTIDSVLINGQYRKRWNFSEGDAGGPTFIIEGIGTSAGLLEPLYPYNLEWTTRYLICVKDSSQTYFASNHYSKIGCNSLYTRAHELNLLNKFSILPNPFSDEAILRTDQQLKNATATITNTFGQQIKQIKNITGKEIKIQRGNLSSGIYFLQLMQENKIILTAKLIIY